MFIITSPKQLLRYWAYIGLFIVFGIYIFFVRLGRINLSFNIYEILAKINFLIESLSKFSIILIFLFILLLIIFWILLVKSIYKHFRKCLYSLYIYYYQYTFFRKFNYLIIRIESNFGSYLYRRIRIFTKNTTILEYTLFFWPACILDIEKKIFHCLIPYLIIFDFCTQDGNISSIFVILPWFYLYTLIRSTLSLLGKFFLAKDLSWVEYVYGLK